MANKIEDILQAEIVKEFNNNYCLRFHSPRGIIFSVPNGGNRNKIEAMTLKSNGLLAGVSDLILITPKGKLYFLELKTEIGVQSEVQKDFQKRIEALGYEYKLIRSLNEFKIWIQSK